MNNLDKNSNERSDNARNSPLRFNFLFTVLATNEKKVLSFQKLWLVLLSVSCSFSLGLSGSQEEADWKGRGMHMREVKRPKQDSGRRKEREGKCRRRNKGI